ncbi:MAG: NADH-quinone oxidoreductase subunit C [Actinomycetales bacterium]|nr:NADH-quinone oxidoreductase subunit C [Actinomycetales bacterium]
MSEDVVKAGKPLLQVTTVREGMFGASGSGDTSGFGGLVSVVPVPAASALPFGGYFDVIHAELIAALPLFGTSYDKAIEKVVIAHDEMTIYVHPSELVALARTLRDEPGLRFELCLGVSGVHYPNQTGAELHAVYHFRSITHNRRVRLEVVASDAHPHIPSIVSVYPTNDWHERETFDFFGIIFDGHPHLTRIQMPDDWQGHPQRKDYPLGGIPVEYKGATVPAPDQRRSYN